MLVLALSLSLSLSLPPPQNKQENIFSSYYNNLFVLSFGSSIPRFGQVSRGGNSSEYIRPAFGSHQDAGFSQPGSKSFSN
jgi:hypothetical protein